MDYIWCECALFLPTLDSWITSVADHAGDLVDAFRAWTTLKSVCYRKRSSLAFDTILPESL
jgi:hypothetical protein